MRLSVASKAQGRVPAATPVASSLPSPRVLPHAGKRRCPSGVTRPQRNYRLECKADVNWDAFRYGSEYSPKGARHGAPPPSSRPASSLSSLSSSVKQFDFIVVGSGIAGLSYALKVAEYGSVAVITKDYANEGCTQYAQGGVCAVLDKTDSVQDHVNDTMVAGAFLNDPQAVEAVCREGPARVLELVRLGAEFTRNSDGSLHLTREGGHNNRRIVHAADMTGAEIERALLAQARSHRNINFFEHHLAVELVTDEYQGMQHCFGVDVLDQRSMSVSRFIGLATLLASGGAGQVYPNTTNPHVATGDGIAMAYRAGARVSNMEFIQFHPTALYSPHGPSGSGGRTFLISEAVRGEGGMLLNLAGERFMPKYDSRLELAPRDIVARSIFHQMTSRNEPHVWLDISHKPKHDVLHHFPNIAAKCKDMGIDITQDPIPVLPAQHYTCGGVDTGLLGETSIQGLYACGEVSCSGLHGANRLASNSLLEGLVFGDRAVNPSVAHAEHAKRNCSRQLHYAAASADFRGPRGARMPSAQLSSWVANKRQELRELMWRNCGIVRRTGELESALDHIVALCVEAKAVYKSYGLSTEVLELYNLATVAELIVSCALMRKESRGGHYVLDYPEENEKERRPSTISTSATERYDVSRGPAGHGSVLHLTGTKGSMGSPRASGLGGKKKKVFDRDRLAVRAVAEEDASA